jgi:hypothetical protein
MQSDDFLFDRFVEALQEIAIDDNFTNLKEDFFDKYCSEFEDNDENKLCYMTIFKKYTETMENYLTKVNFV